jgi:hypothetical protein
MNAEAAQMVPASGWTGGRVLGVDRVYHVVAGEVLQPLPKESRFGFVDDARLPARGPCHVWTAPVDQGFFCGVAIDCGCGHVFGLLMWVMTPVGPDVVC